MEWEKVSLFERCVSIDDICRLNGCGKEEKGELKMIFNNNKKVFVNFLSFFFSF